MAKPYVNSWRGYEKSYVTLLLMDGVDFYDVEERLNDYNIRLGAPCRSAENIKVLFPGIKRSWQHKRMRQIANARLYGLSCKEIKKAFGCCESVIRRNVRMYKAGLI